jgi:hypothetical protein
VFLVIIVPITIVFSQNAVFNIGGDDVYSNLFRGLILNGY